MIKVSHTLVHKTTLADNKVDLLLACHIYKVGSPFLSKEDTSLTKQLL